MVKTIACFLWHSSVTGLQTQEWDRPVVIAKNIELHLSSKLPAEHTLMWGLLLLRACLRIWQL